MNLLDTYDPQDKADILADLDSLNWFISWLKDRVWFYFTHHPALTFLAIIGLISIYFFIIKLHRKYKALELRLKRIEKND